VPLSFRFYSLSLLGGLALFCAQALAEEWELCPGVRLKAPEKLSFSRTEEVLVCGDKSLPAWREVPRSQAVFHLKAFLQERGYYNPTTDQTPDRVLVDAGERTIVRAVEMTGSGANLDLSRFRGIEGQTLTPSLLQQTEKRFVKELQALGHGCPAVDLEGYPAEGRIKMTIEAGPVGHIREVLIEPVEEINEQILRRYHAFYPDALFNERWLDLTVNRIHAQGILQNTLFEVSCDGTAIDILEKNVAGPPRLVTIGFGVNTEKGLAARASWKHVRLGDGASPVEISLTGYFGGSKRNEQELSASAYWYYRDRPSRFHIKPVVSIRHASQESSELVSTKIQLTPGMTWDGQNAGGSLYAGPALIGVRTFRGPGAKQTAYLTLGADLSVTSHAYELYRTSPREGYELTLGGSFSRRGWLGELTAQSVNLGGHYLWNLGNYDPPLFVLGVRASFATTLSPASEQGNLPDTLRHYLGGAASLRGFTVREIPSKLGALTAAFGSVELRLGYLIPWNLQPFVFFDLGKTGSLPMSLDQPWLYSPGLGLRWESPIGAFRTSIAHGFVSGSPPAGFDARSHFQFFISYGEEF
jgi:translocation and assembly module TamA